MKFYTKDGWLTDYALSCGYCELREVGGHFDPDNSRVRLYKEHGVYIVFALIEGERVLNSYRMLADARRCYKTLNKRIAALS